MSVKTLDMLELLHPFMDGYAMNLIWPENQTVKAARYEFAGERVIASYLANDPGSFLFQVHTFSDRTDVSLLGMEALSERGRRARSKRIDRTARALQNYKSRTHGTELQTNHFFHLITSRTGREWAYANKDLKVYFLCQVKSDEMEIWLGAGPAGREDDPRRITQKI
jgi:hypothetical protein